MTQQARVEPQAVARPIAVTILAVLNLLVGGGGILISPLSLFTVLAAAPPNQQAPDSLANLQGISFLWLIGSHCASVLLLAAGLGLLRMKIWAWWMSVGCAAFALVAFLLSRAILFVMSIGAGASRDAYFFMLVVGTAMLCLPSFVHPTLTLFILLPRHVRQAFEQEARRRAQDHAPPIADCAPSGATDRASRATSAMGWFLFGPQLPPYRNAKEHDASWKWAVLLAPTTFAVLLAVTVVAFARFEGIDAPELIMGTLALIVGSLGLAGALFEWHWFFENRSARGVRWWAGDQGARWLYVGVSVVLLLLGSHLVGYAGMRSMAGKSDFFTATGASPAITPGAFSGQRSPLCGGTGGNPFERFDPALRPMIGLRYELGAWNNQQVVARIEPLFDRSTPGNRVVMAKDGYQVGGLLVDSRDTVNAVRIIFVRADGAQEGGGESYQSDWIGATPNQRLPQRIGDDGRRVVGIFGRQGIITDAIGLLYEPSDK